MKIFINILFIICIAIGQLKGKTDSEPSTDNKYLQIVQTFADSLLAVGIDHYGPRPTAMWASVIDLRDMSVPIRNVPPTKGVRPHDRALGGSNYYHDVMTMKVFEALSQITQDPKYEIAVEYYSKDLLTYTQNPKTGLLGWGEHLYYHFYRDTVTISESKLFEQKYLFGYPHEFLAWTPSWERLWKIDALRTQKAIEGVMWHFQGPDTKAFLFNRHAHWNNPTHQNVIMPWIKHSVLFAYSFAFLYQKTGEEIWKKRAQDCALLYWNNREYETDLVFNCFFHATERNAGKKPSISSVGLYAYWMYKTAEILEDNKLKNIAKTIMLAYAKYGWNEEEGYFYKEVNLDGTPVENPEKATAWKIGYGSSSLFSYGRAATYLASVENNEDFLNLAIECEKQIPGTPLPQQFTALNIGEVINFYVDLYELTNKKYYLQEAKKYADLGIEKFHQKGLFARQTDDHYYEAKLGIGDLVSGIFRVGMIEAGKEQELSKFDFSF